MARIAAVAIDRLEVSSSSLEVVVDQPFLAAVDRNHRAAAPRVERQRHPGRRALIKAEQPRRADIGRLHALDDRRSLQIGADRLADQRTRAVAADDEIGMNRATSAPSSRLRTVATTPSSSCAEIRRTAVRFRMSKPGDRRGMREQDRLQVDLVDAMRRLRRRPTGIRSAGGGIAIARGRESRMRESSMPVDRGAVGNSRSGSRRATRHRATLAATPSRRKISIERAETWLHFTLGGSPRGASLQRR